ncbi:MAG TPA: OsmC family protein [Rhizomicrobium sp.]|nr:OsmC family protein [Rhizomicrobium sp.]
MAETPITASVTETRKSPYSVEVVVDGHEIEADEPESSGGKNLGPYPHEILVAALGACTAQTVRWYADRHGWPLDAVSVDLTYAREHLEGHSGLLDVFDKAVRLTGPNLTREQRGRLLDVAGKCPIQRLMEGMPVIRTREKL